MREPDVEGALASYEAAVWSVLGRLEGERDAARSLIAEMLPFVEMVAAIPLERIGDGNLPDADVVCSWVNRNHDGSTTEHRITVGDVRAARALQDGIGGGDGG